MVLSSECSHLCIDRTLHKFRWGHVLLDRWQSLQETESWYHVFAHLFWPCFGTDIWPASPKDRQNLTCTFDTTHNVIKVAQYHTVFHSSSYRSLTLWDYIVSLPQISWERQWVLDSPLGTLDPTPDADREAHKCGSQLLWSENIIMSWWIHECTNIYWEQNNLDVEHSSKTEYDKIISQSWCLIKIPA